MNSNISKNDNVHSAEPKTKKFKLRMYLTYELSVYKYVYSSIVCIIS